MPGRPLDVLGLVILNPHLHLPDPASFFTDFGSRQVYAGFIDGIRVESGFGKKPAKDVQDVFHPEGF